MEAGVMQHEADSTHGCDFSVEDEEAASQGIWAASGSWQR